ncbi:MAG: gluconate 2-dehydrogenase subunit 3 family protein [Bryobacteraceae bacterium]
MSLDVNRREVLKWLSATALAAPLALPAPDPTAPLYFSKDEYQLLDTLTELIIPADDHSPGSHEAGVAKFIDKSVAEAFLPEEKTSWRKGLAGVNTLAHSMHNQPFLQLDKDQQKSVLQSMLKSEKAERSNALNEGDSGENRSRTAQKFWGQLKQTTVFAYYSSSIGIHKEMNYKGNVFLNDFVGYLPDEALPAVSSLSSM